jgi:hypothetical protein
MSVPLTGNVLGRSLDDDAICYLSWPSKWSLEISDNGKARMEQLFIGKDSGEDWTKGQA